MSLASASLAGPGVGGGAFAARKRRPPRHNVLFIAVDDLRPALGCYGDSIAKTPHIDRLAAEGLTFERAYCQQAGGGPSRASVMTGMRPDSTGVYDSLTHFRRRLPGAVTLPQQFQKYGYAATAFGKIYDAPELDDPPSWSIPPWVPGGHPWRSEENRLFFERKRDELRQAGWVAAQPEPGAPTPSWQSLNVGDGELDDGRTAAAAAEAVGELRGGRFFLGVGFLRPHLPFAAPSKYFDLYPPRSIEPTKNLNPPAGAPDFALHQSSELRRYSDIPPSGAVPSEKARELIRAYYACVSYVDAQVGVLLAALDRHRLRENTVVVLWSDHGYHLGEHGLWNKHSNFETAVRAPLIVSAPGLRGVGRKTPALTEFVDIYPSLCDICGVPKPAGLEGSSFAPLFDDPDRLWKRAVFSQYPREIPGVGLGVGYTMRTHRYRYTEWSAEGSGFRAAELYDHEVDPGENVNIAAGSRNVSLVNGLSGMLREGWKTSLPPTELPSS